MVDLRCLNTCGWQLHAFLFLLWNPWHEKCQVGEKSLWCFTRIDNNYWAKEIYKCPLRWYYSCDRIISALPEVNKNDRVKGLVSTHWHTSTQNQSKSNDLLCTAGLSLVITPGCKPIQILFLSLLMLRGSVLKSLGLCFCFPEENIWIIQWWGKHSRVGICARSL